MGKSEFRQLIKEYFSFTRSERNGMLMLVILLTAAMVLNLLADQIDFKKPAGHEHFLALTEQLKQQNTDADLTEKRLFDFDPNTISGSSLELLNIPQKLKTNLVRYRLKGGSFRKPEDMMKLYGMNDSLYAVVSPYVSIRNEKISRKVPETEPSSRVFHEFDPNTASEEELRFSGFNPYQARNLVNYREKGGKFRAKSDLLKIYGMDSLFYGEISNYIKIENRSESSERNEIVTRLELNLADSAALTTLPGIGPVFAGRIIRYRALLGGYCSTGQLLEVYGMTGEKITQLTGFVTVDPSLVTPVRINFADYRTLSFHPYISGEQAKKIISWRAAHGMIPDKNLLLENKLLDTISYRKVESYLSCR